MGGNDSSLHVIRDKHTLHTRDKLWQAHTAYS